MRNEIELKQLTHKKCYIVFQKTQIVFDQLQLKDYATKIQHNQYCKDLKYSSTADFINASLHSLGKSEVSLIHSYSMPFCVVCVIDSCPFNKSVPFESYLLLASSVNLHKLNAHKGTINKSAMRCQTINPLIMF